MQRAVRLMAKTWITSPPWHSRRNLRARCTTCMGKRPCSQMISRPGLTPNKNGCALMRHSLSCKTYSRLQSTGSGDCLPTHQRKPRWSASPVPSLTTDAPWSSHTTCSTICTSNCPWHPNMLSPNAWCSRATCPSVWTSAAWMCGVSPTCSARTSPQVPHPTLSALPARIGASLPTTGRRCLRTTTSGGGEGCKTCPSTSMHTV
mmetsp:Transcript_1803/g.4580  ORF Transcript_1803/g.4580 Transcript_1803/m.4580 type:complete len:204 (+) Transcript_1803:1197-1808(+)